MLYPPHMTQLTALLHVYLQATLLGMVRTSEGHHLSIYINIRKYGCATRRIRASSGNRLAAIQKTAGASSVCALRLPKAESCTEELERGAGRGAAAHRWHTAQDQVDGLYCEQ